MVLHGTMKNKNSLVALVTFVTMTIACNAPPKDNSQQDSLKTISSKKKISAPDFNADSAYLFVKNQVEFGPRVPASIPHRQCATFLEEKLKSYRFNVYEQNGTVTTFDSKKFNLKNIIASYKPNEPSRILLCAHWDTRPFADRDIKDKDLPIDGANDGASGVAVLLEIARQINRVSINTGIDIILFDLEDYGQPHESKFPAQDNTWCLGSQYWGNNLHKPGYYANYGILLDMVGAKNATFLQEGNSELYASAILKKVWKASERLGYSDYFLNTKIDGITDDHYYINALTAIPTIDIVHMDPSTKDFGNFHHRHSDNMDVIDKNTLKAVGQTILDVIYSE